MAEAFISWSGDGSRQIAEGLQKLLGRVLPRPSIFVASQDIKGGELWFTRIAERLDACDVGIIVVTPQNIHRPWLHFEAGALAKKMGQSAVIPILCGITVGDLAETALAQLQSVQLDKPGVRGICSRLNQLLNCKVDEREMDEVFEVWWEREKDDIMNPSHAAGSNPKTNLPSTADLSVQITQLQSMISGLMDRVERKATANALEQIGSIFEDISRTKLKPVNSLSGYLVEERITDVNGEPILDSAGRPLTAKVFRRPAGESSQPTHSFSLSPAENRSNDDDQN